MGSSGGGGAARDARRVRAVLDALFPKPPKGSGTLALSEVAVACRASPKTVGNWRTSGKVPNDDSLPLLIELVRDSCGDSAADELAECYGRLRARNDARSRDGQSRAGQFNAELAGRRPRTPAWLQRLLLTIRTDGNVIPTIVSRMDTPTDADEPQAATHWGLASQLTHGRMPRYVPRSIDVEIDRRLDTPEGAIVIVVGEPRAGKTRTVAEALLRHPLLSQRPLHEIPPPSDGRDTLSAYTEAFNEALAHDIGPPIVFIDDLHHHLRSPETGLQRTTPLATALRRIAQAATVVATSEEWLVREGIEGAALSQEDQAWLRAHAVALANELDEHEQSDANRLLQVEPGVELVRLGEALAGPDVLTAADGRGKRHGAPADVSLQGDLVADSILVGATDAAEVRARFETIRDSLAVMSAGSGSVDARIGELHDSVLIGRGDPEAVARMMGSQSIDEVLGRLGVQRSPDRDRSEGDSNDS